MRTLILALLALLSLSVPLQAQVEPEGPLLPDTISENDVDMRAQFVRQWREPDGTIVLVFTGGFQLDMGPRRLSALNAVVWITPKLSEPLRRKYYELTVYLSEDARVREPAGTIVEDQVLLVSALRTFGKVVKHHDAHSPDNLSESPLYQRALADRRRIEAGPVSTQPAVEPEVTRPADASIAQRRPPRAVRFRFPRGIEPTETDSGEQAYVAVGRIYFSVSGGPDAALLEIQADNAVVFPKKNASGTIFGLGQTAATSQPAGEPASRPAEQLPPRTADADQSPEARAASDALRGIYLEGDVVLTLGPRFVRADRLYYDIEHDRALILDAVLRADIPERNIPLYIRADQIRQLSAREFSAGNARVTTSEFYTPHYHVGAERVYLRDSTPRDAAGQSLDRLAGTYELDNATLNVNNVPLLWWPRTRGKLDTSETALRRMRIGFSDNRGAELETSWRLFNLIGVEEPKGVDATLRLDYYSDRGPAVGIDSNYSSEDYFGLLRSFYINDHGVDTLGPLRDNTPDSDNRGRFLVRHRQYLPDDWELTMELSYISDPGFLEEYEKNEQFEDKQQETLLYLKRAKDVDAFTFLLNWRLLDFVTQTEHLPDLNYYRIGDVLDPFVLYHESRFGAVRLRTDDRRLFDSRRFNNDGRSDVTLRADVRQEAELPLKLGSLNIVPFATLRGSYWDGQPLNGGGLWRGLGVYGVRGGTYLSRVFDNAQSELLDVNRIRHIILPRYAAWWASSNTRSDLITPFDEGVETIGAFYGGLFGVKQIWQTKRGGAEHERTVDWITFDIEAGFFGGDEDVQDETSNGYVNIVRPEDSRSRNYVAGDFRWRASDSTTMLYEFNIDLDDGQSDRQNIAVAVERLPRLAYIFGYRRAGDIDLDLVGGGFNYKLTEKHRTAVRLWADTDRGRLGQFDWTYIRKLPRWWLAVNFEIDEVFDDVQISVSLWPEGIPEWTIGSRRFTGLSNFSGIRP